MKCDDKFYPFKIYTHVKAGHLGDKGLNFSGKYSEYLHVSECDMLSVNCYVSHVHSVHQRQCQR